MRRGFQFHGQFLALWTLVLSLAKGLLGRVSNRQSLEQHFLPNPLATEFLCIQRGRRNTHVSITTCLQCLRPCRAPSILSLPLISSHRHLLCFLCHTCDLNKLSVRVG